MARHDQNDIGSDILVFRKQNNQVVVLSLGPIHSFDRWDCSLIQASKHSLMKKSLDIKGK